MIAITDEAFKAHLKNARLVAIRHNGANIIELKLEEPGQEHTENPSHIILQVEAVIPHGEFETLEVTTVRESRWYLS